MTHNTSDPKGRRRARTAAVAFTGFLLALAAFGGYGIRSATDDEAQALRVATRVAGQAQILEHQVRALGGQPRVNVPAPAQLPVQVPGPAGIPGIPGVPGVPGVPGEPGRPGAPGVAGAAGAAGEAGATGPRGRAGRPGSPGEAGPSGETVVGPQGDPGPAGPPGESVTGPPGETGPQGPQGPPPACAPDCQGPTGPAGPQGQQGAAGQSAFPFTFTFQPTPGQTTTCTISSPTDFTCDTQPSGGS